jgi:hypothetical protein
MANKIWDIIIGNFGESTSLFGKLNKQDVYKILRTASLIGVGSALAYMTGALDTVEWGVSEAVILAGLTAATEAVQRLLKDNKGE